MVDLLEDARLFAQIIGLERRTARGGHDSIDHPPGAHDDVSAVAGVVDVLTANKSGYDAMLWVSGPYDDGDGPPVIRTPRGTGQVGGQVRFPKFQATESADFSFGRGRSVSREKRSPSGQAAKP